VPAGPLPGRTTKDGPVPGKVPAGGPPGDSVPGAPAPGGRGSGRTAHGDGPVPRPVPNPAAEPAPRPTEVPGPAAAPAPPPAPQPAAAAAATEDELPHRIRQASLASQLREAPKDHPARSAGTTGTARSPEGARATMTALAEGWTRGRNSPMPHHVAPPRRHLRIQQESETSDARDDELLR
jgi:hypothetical protein